MIGVNGIDKLTLANTAFVSIDQSGFADFVSIQAAIDWAATHAPTAAAPWDIIISAGVYTEALTLVAHVNLRGLDKDACIIDIDHATLITMAEGCCISNLTLDVTSDATASGFGVELNDAACTLEDVNIILNRSAGAFAYGIIESTGATARIIHIRNVRIQMTDNTNERGIGIEQAGKTVYIEESWIQGSDYGVAIGVSGGGAVASTIYSSHNHYEATSAASRSVFNNGGTIRMNGDTIGQVDHTGAGITRENDGIITCKNIPLEYEVFAGMSVQDAITSAAADAPAPAATALYTILIHPGIYDEAIICATWVNLKGIGPKGAVVIQQVDANIITLATQVQLQNFTVRLVTPTAARRLVRDNSVACTARFTDLVMEITTPVALSHYIFYLQGAGNYTIERCSYNIGGTGVSVGIWNSTVGATFHLVNNDFEFTNVNAIHIRSSIAGTWTGGGNRWAGTSQWAVGSQGTILFDGDRVDCSGGSTITGGSFCIKNGQQEYHVWAGMLIQHAITAAAADTPTPAAIAPYTILIHPGIYDETVSCATWVNLKGIGPKGSVIISRDDANVLGLADNIQVENFTVRIVTPTRTIYVIYDGGGAYTARISDVIIEVTTPGVQIIHVFAFSGAGNYTIERCSFSIGGSGVSLGVRNQTNTAVAIRLIDNDFEFTSGNAILIRSDRVTSWISRGNRYSGACKMFLNVNGTFLFDNDAILCTGAWSNTGNITMTFKNCAIEAPVVAGNLALVRLKNCSYRAISRAGTGNIVDESPCPASTPWKVQKWDWMTALASMDVGVRGTPLDAGSGQVLLEVTDNIADFEAVETNPEAAGSLGNEFTPARTPRWVGKIAVDSFDAHVTMFHGLRETLGDAIPLAAEHHAGFNWNGTNFRAVSSDGAVIEATNLTTPTVNVQVTLEVIIIGGVEVEFYIDGILVATHSTRVPTNTLDWQHELVTAGAGGGDAIDVTIRDGWCQECPN